MPFGSSTLKPKSREGRRYKEMTNLIGWTVVILLSPGFILDSLELLRSIVALARFAP